MARFVEPTPEQERAWREWVAERPPEVRAVAEQFDPWTLYWMPSSRHRVTLRSFDETEDGRVTLRVVVSGRFNAVIFDREVFGIEPDGLVECDLPDPDELVGSLDLTDDEVRSMPGLTAKERSIVYSANLSQNPNALRPFGKKERGDGD